LTKKDLQRKISADFQTRCLFKQRNLDTSGIYGPGIQRVLSEIVENLT